MRLIRTSGLPSIIGGLQRLTSGLASSKHGLYRIALDYLDDPDCPGLPVLITGRPPEILFQIWPRLGARLGPI